jgi:hypothetical protein
MQRPPIREVDEVDPAQAEDGRVRRLVHFGNAGAQHAAAADVLAVLIVQIVRRVERPQRVWRRIAVCRPAVAAERPAIEAARAPAHSVQRVVVRVVNDGADVVVDAKHLGGLHRLGFDPVNDRTAVRAVLCRRNPDVHAVVVDAARMIDRPFPEPEIGNEVAGHVDLEQVADAFAGIPVMAARGFRQALGCDPDLDGRDEHRVADFHHALGMVGSEPHRDRRHQRPRRASREFRDALGDDRSRVGRDGWPGRDGSREDHRRCRDVHRSGR